MKINRSFSVLVRTDRESNVRKYSYSTRGEAMEAASSFQGNLPGRAGGRIRVSGTSGIEIQTWLEHDVAHTSLSLAVSNHQ